MPTRITTILPCEQLTVGDGNWEDATNRGPIQSIVLHTIDGSIAGANARFNTQGSKVSVHYGVGLDGKLYQWCDEVNVAYHAGNYAVNCTSIGIEHEDGGDYNGVRPDVLYETSAKLVADICKFYEIPCDSEHIFRHHDVIDKTYFPGGTACPDALDTDRIIRQAYDILHPAPISAPQPVVAPQEATVSQPEQTLTQAPINPVAPEPAPAPVVEQPAPEPEVVQPPITTPAEPVEANIPDQTASNSAEASQNISTQPQMVSEPPKVDFSAPTSPKWGLFNWLYRLLVLLWKIFVYIVVYEEVKQ